MTATIEVSEDGTLRLPKEVLEELHVGGSSRVTWHVDNGRLVLSPATDIPEEDAWAHTPEHKQAVLRSRDQRGYRLGPSDVEELIEAARAADQTGRVYTVDEADLQAREARHRDRGRA